MLYAHDWEILGGDRIRRWPGPDERTITVQVNSWVGISPGAKHYKAIVTEQNNQWWCEQENCWAELSCDTEKGGYSMRAECMTEDEANQMARLFVEMIQKNNPDQKYRVFYPWGDEDV